MNAGSSVGLSLTLTPESCKAESFCRTPIRWPRAFATRSVLSMRIPRVLSSSCAYMGTATCYTLRVAIRSLLNACAAKLNANASM